MSNHNVVHAQKSLVTLLTGMEIIKYDRIQTEFQDARQDVRCCKMLGT